MRRETVMDESLSEQPEIWFEAGDREQLVQVSREQFSTLAGNHWPDYFTASTQRRQILRSANQLGN